MPTVRTKRDIVLTYSDNSGHSLEISQEVGDYSLDIPRESLVHVLDRGSITAQPMLRLGDDQICTSSFTAYETLYSSTTATTLMDLGTRPTGSYAETTWVSTSAAFSDAFTVNQVMTIDGASFGEADVTVTFPYTSVRTSRADGDPNTVSVSNEHYVLVPTVS